MNTAFPEQEILAKIILIKFSFFRSKPQAPSILPVPSYNVQLLHQIYKLLHNTHCFIFVLIAPYMACVLK